MEGIIEENENWTDEVELEYSKFIQECKKSSLSTSSKANRYIFLNNTSNLLVITLACSVGILAGFTEQNILASIVGFSIAFLKGIQDIMKFPSKGTIYKKASFGFQRLMNNATNQLLLPKKNRNSEPLHLLKKMMELKQEMEIEVFRMSILSNELPKKDDTAVLDDVMSRRKNITNSPTSTTTDVKINVVEDKNKTP